MENEIADKILRMKLGEHADIIGLREEIHDEFDRSSNSEERGELLRLFTILMDFAEKNMRDSGATVEQLASFSQAREQDYSLFLAKESTIDGNVCSDILDEVTRREITAGRMSSDHKLRELAAIGTTFGVGTKKELIDRQRSNSQSPVWRRVMNWFGKGVSVVAATWKD